MERIILIIILVLQSAAIISAQTSGQRFDPAKMEYKGDKPTQAKLLLRNVAMWGVISKKDPVIDSDFLKLLTSPFTINKAELRAYLKKQTIPETDIGGSLDKPVSFIILNNTKVYAKYFIIHDVSSPAYKDKFPTDLDKDSWSFNNPKNWTKKVTHTYLTRTGKFKTVTDFSEGLRATKFELSILGVRSRGLYLHIELVQPRVYPPGNSKNAPVAPTPGFTDIQYKKLALLYVCASLRKGEWLVPGFHVNVDEGLSDGHDDPQNFKIEKFTSEVLKLVKEIN